VLAAEKFVLALKNRLSNTTKHFHVNRLNVSEQTKWQPNFGAQNSTWQPNGSGIQRHDSSLRTSHRFLTKIELAMVLPGLRNASPPHLQERFVRFSN
jgi:hypothetical protein